jgi:hypothetical protein
VITTKPLAYPGRTINATGAKPRLTLMNTPSTSSNQPSFGKQPLVSSTGQWFRVFLSNVGELFFPAEKAPSSPHAISENASKTIETAVKEGESYKKRSGACFDRPLKTGGSQHTHHFVYAGPTIHGNGEAQKTSFWVGETLASAPGIALDPGQKAVQVNANLVKNFLKTSPDPLKLDTLPKQAFQSIKSHCFDFPNGEHTHHGVYTGPKVVVTDKNGKPRPQDTLILVGQWLCAKLLREKGLKVDPDVQMGILVTDNLFQQGKTIQHG